MFHDAIGTGNAEYSLLLVDKERQVCEFRGIKNSDDIIHRNRK